MSEIRANTISDAAGTGPVTLTKQSAAKAFIDFVGTGTVNIRSASFNISSLTDNGTGEYAPNLSSAMAANDFCTVSGISGSGIVNFGDGEVRATSTTTISLRTYTSNIGGSNGGLTDFNYNYIVAFGDLA